MLSKKLKLLIASLGLVAYLLSFVLRVDGVVLCLGQDGHVQLEIAAPNLTCRVSAPVEDGSAMFAQSLLDSCHCGPCIDVSPMLTNPDTIVRVVPVQDEAVKIQLVAATNFKLSLLPILTATPKEPVQRFSASHFLLATLRTVILLI
jgi:hypothetical protein